MDSNFYVRPLKLFVPGAHYFPCDPGNCACTGKRHIACIQGNCECTGRRFILSPLEILRAQGRTTLRLP
jgi:hypothetical protein